MVTVLIASLFLLIAISFAIHRLGQRNTSNENAEKSLPPPPPRFSGLFGDGNPSDARSNKREIADKLAQQYAALLTRATQGDKEALRDAHTSGDAALYDEVLNALLEQASASDKQLLALVSFITRSEDLSVNTKLAEAFTEAWKNSPGRNTTAEMLHIAALSNDAATYQKAVETALQFWRDRRLPDMSAEELRTLFDSEYWVLASDARSSGGGFVLKRKLERCRRELRTAAARSVR